MNVVKMIALSTSMMILAHSHSAISYAQEGTAQTKQVTSPTRVVYGVAVSPFVRAVRVVMHELNIPYELKEVLPVKLLNALKMEIPADFAKVSPLGKIPAYTEGDFSLSDSRVISNYLHATTPGSTLYSKDAKEKARQEWFVKYTDEVIVPVIHGDILIERVVKKVVLKAETNEKVVQEALTTKLPPILDYLEKEIGDKEWIAGSHFSMADIAIGTLFAGLKTAGEKVDATKYPKLASYIDRIHDRDSFKKVM